MLLLLPALGAKDIYAQLQGQERLDSLLKELPRQKEDTNKVALLQTVASEYAEIMPQKGVEYGQQALALAQKLHWKTGAARAYTALGTNYNNMSRHNISLENYIAAAKLYQETGNKKGEARAIGNMGSIYRSLGDSTKALESFTKALQMFEELGEKKGVAIYTGNIGNLYCDELHNFPKALEYMEKSLKYFEEMGDKAGITRTTYNMGNVYGMQGNYLAAVASYRRSLKMAEETGNKIQMANNLCNIGSTYVHIVETGASGKPYGNVTAGTSKELQAGNYSAEEAIPVSKAALLAGGIKYLNSALAIANEISYLSGVIDCQKMLARAYTETGDYKKAFEAMEVFHTINDSVYSMENNEQFVKMNLGYEYERQRLTDSLKTAEKEKIATLNLQKQKTYTYLGIAGILALAGFSFFIVKERGKSEKERKKSDELLLNILPSEVAEELKVNGSTTARHHDNVTVLFTDFVNFTHASANMGAQALIDELHTCFKMFDEITGKYNIEKIKTIGDAYLAVGGLPVTDPKHAENTVRAAIEMNNYMQDRLAKLGSRTFAIRIGIHTGSVVAGIVGVKKFQFDVWGDTVNTAARMEQHSEGGKINISDATYNLVKDKINCTYRGEIDVKGKGHLKMYYVNG